MIEMKLLLKRSVSLEVSLEGDFAELPTIRHEALFLCTRNLLVTHN
jgi:hypothetical protein